MRYISLDTLIEKYIEKSTIDFCTDDSAYGFVLGLTTQRNHKIIIKLNLNYFSPYGKSGETKIRGHSKKRGTKKNQNIDDLKREVSNQIEFSKLSTAIPLIKDSAIIQRKDAIKFSKALQQLQGNCDALPGWSAHLISQLQELDVEQHHEYETKTGVIIMDSVGDLTLNDIVEGHYSELQNISLENHTTEGHTIADTFIGKGRALLLSLLWMGILHGDPHMENIRVDSTTGKLYLIDFGASIDFGSGLKHLPKYLQRNENTKDAFSEIKEDVDQWLSLKEPYNEHGFIKQYRTNGTIDNSLLEKLLEYTIIKADPRQNGELLAWSDIDYDNRWELYRSGYQWIVDIDESSPKWKDMIRKGVYSNVPLRDSSSTRIQTRRRKDNRRHKKTQKKPITSSSMHRKEEDKFGEFPLNVDLNVTLNNYKRQSLMGASNIQGIPILKNDTKKTIMHKIIKAVKEDPSISSNILNRLSRQSRRPSSRRPSVSGTRRSNRLLGIPATT